MATVTGTAGNDNLFGLLNEWNSISGLAGNDYLQGGYLLDYIYGGDGNDTLSGQGGDDQLYGQAGDDYLYGGGGGDYLSSGTGQDSLYGDGGDDTIFLANGLVGETKIVYGGAGDDYIYAGAANDLLDGGQGQDVVNYIYSTAGVVVNLLSGVGSGGYAAGDTYRSIEDVQGSSYQDQLMGNGNYNELFGLSGDDVIAGGAGGDYLDGGAGTDILSYRFSDLAVRINLTTGLASGGHAEGDQFTGFERVQGSEFADAIVGDAATNVLGGFGGNDSLNGQDGNDGLYAHAGNDILAGHNGNDTLYGGDGNDVLIGGIGADKLYGESGADRFDFNSTAESTPAVAGRDIIFDFSQAQGDRIDLASIDANTAAANNQAFIFKGTAGFSGSVGELRYTKLAADTFVYGDVNGDTVADITIHLKGAITLTAADFIV
ncbi:calcium-binding protein [Sinorhizobium meliloti]|uniref:calcium-binding protein n=1 Tax=Rhizobium meliloti TaxID=382 RepID=UPI0023801374|nr:calcium-binding protein [Sinorhizobium meliloti]MDE3816034.1 calcium-binding protein [Sinorhizobium meliloti]MDW9503382.1 protease [Sinorhizobium meliloti]MDW9614765.1 protease [Sinorhizobium meliloti]MDW9766062.1 protease [Sinorhizobium meliloti]MDW9837434.1 protease [Sinorhizobium meliloti]